MSRYISEMEFLLSLAKKPRYSSKTIGEALDEVPSIDIVRCKECKWYDTDVWTTRCWCGRVSSIGNCKYVKPDDFCSYGEREGE